MFEQLFEAIKNRFKQFFHWFAANDLNFDMDKKYASHPIDIRMKLASNPTTNPNDLEKLAKDTSKEVQLAVASNKSTPIYALDGLAYSNDEDIIKAALSNPAIRFTTINQFYQEGKYLDTILKNPVIPNTLLKDYIHSKDPTIKMAILQNPNVSDEILTHFTKDTNNGIARLSSDILAQHKNFRDCDKHIEDAKKRAEEINNNSTNDKEKTNNKDTPSK